MNLRHMEVFRLVMQTGSVKGAAAAMHISEPAGSKLLAAAERHSSVRLFVRVRGRLVPTPEALRLREEVDVLWEQIERINRLSAELVAPSEGAVTVNVSPSLGTVLAPKTAAMLLERMPSARIKLDLLVPHQLLQTLREGSADVGLSLGPHEHPDIAVVSQYECDLVCAMPAGHRLVKKRLVRPADLVGERVISFPQATVYGLTDTVLYGGHAASIRSQVDLRSGQGACWFSKSGGGIAIVDTAVVAGGAFGGLVVRPYDCDARLSLKVMHHRLKPLSKTATAFCECFDAVWTEHLGR